MPIVRKNNRYVENDCDPDLYDAIILEIKEVEDTVYKKKRLWWTFQIIEPTLDGEPIQNDINLIGFTGAVPSNDPKNTLNNWLLVCGINLDDEEDFEMTDLISKRVRVVVEKKAKKGSNDPPRPRIMNLLAFKKAKPAQQTQAAAAPQQARTPLKKQQPVEDPDVEDVVNAIEQQVAEEPASLPQRTAKTKPMPAAQASTLQKKVQVQDKTVPDDDLFDDLDGPPVDEDGDVPFSQGDR